jgi:L-lactate dehydrogenase (cytochrome)
MPTAVNIEDLRRTARRRLPKPIFEFLDGGASDERTLAANRTDFAAIGLRPRVLRDVARRAMATTVLGQSFSHPFLLAPTGLTSAFWPRGEVGAARAAKAAGIGYCLSTNATTSIEDMASIYPGYWFQLYALKDRKMMWRLFERAKAARCPVLMLTVDLAAHGRRERDYRNGFSVPPRVTPRNVVAYASRPGWAWRLLTGPRITFANFDDLEERGLGFTSLANYVASQFDASLSWRDVAEMRKAWPGRLVLKGVVTAEDTRIAADHGVDGIIVSNHGGRQLDGAPSAIQALGEVVAAAAGRLEVLLDSGVRRGSDVVKALAMGARACLVGRAFLYGVAAAGEAGAARAIEILGAEVDNTLALIGCDDVTRLDRSYLSLPVGEGWPRNT